MSNQDAWTDPNSPEPVVKKKGMSGCMLASLIVGGLGLVIAVACCGAGAWFLPQMIPKPLKVPEDVAAVGKKILNIEVPPDFTPAEGLAWNWSMFDFQIAEFRHKEGKGSLLLGSMKLKFGDASQADLQAKQIRDPFDKKIKGTLETTKTETKDLMIAGQKVAVTFEEATDKDTKKEVHLVSGSLDLPSGRTFFVLRMDEDIWDEEAVIKMLEEAKAP